MFWLVFAIYSLIAIVVYFWWVKECRKYRKNELDSKEVENEIEESGFFFATFWFVFLPIYLVVSLISWFLNKIK